jgi:hypothetical protein
MRPELREDNYDRLMGDTLKIAVRLAASTEKEREYAYRYIPQYRRAARTFINAGEPGVMLMKLLARYYENLLTARLSGKPVVATTFCHTPAVIYAMEMVPATFEIFSAVGAMFWKRGMFEYMDYCCEAGLPETSCSSQRGYLGALLAGLTEKIDLIVCDTPGVCDTNANAFAFASEYLDKPYFQLNYPSVIGDRRSQQYHVDDFKEMIRFLEHHTGRRLDYDKLREVIEEIDRQDALIADLEDLLLLVPTPVPPLYNLGIYAGRFCFSGQPEYTALLVSMVRAARENAEAGISGNGSGEEKLRAFMCYIDHYTFDVNYWNYLDQKGVAHIGSLLTRNFREGNPYLQDLPGSGYATDTSTPEAMLDSIAQMNARLPMVRSIRGPYDAKGMWLEETLACVRLYQADCVIYNGTPGCRNTWGMLKPFARDLERYGYPVHIMYADAFDDRVESWEATRERLDEFFQVRGLL